MFFYDWTLIFAIPGLLLGLWAQAKVSSAYHKYSKISTRGGMTANEVVSRMLERHADGTVRIERVSGQMTDHYDPRSNTLRLSDGVYGSDTIAALGIAAHEAGHAMQKYENYPFLVFRGWVAPVVNIGSALSWPIFLFGLLFSWEPLMNIGIILFMLVVGFTLITLPVEFDASRRAIRILSADGYLTDDELKGAKQVLIAAAMTYVASFISAFMQLLRLLVLARRNDD